jgi:hypothetical protein
MGDFIFDKNAGDLESCYDTYNTVEFSSVGHRVQMGAHHYCPAILAGTVEPAPDIAAPANCRLCSDFFQLRDNVIDSSLVFRRESRSGDAIAGCGIE